MGFEDRYKPLLACLVTKSWSVAHTSSTRHGGVGVAVMAGDDLGYRLHREKFDHHYLFVEYDWDQGPPHGTAIPLSTIDAVPPDDGDALLAWLREREDEHRTAIDAAWETILGYPLRPRDKS